MFWICFGFFNERTGAFPILTQTESKGRVTDIGYGLMPATGQWIKYQPAIVLSLLHLRYFWLPERVIYRSTYGGSTLGNNSRVYQLFGWFLTMPAFESQDSNNRTLAILFNRQIFCPADSTMLE